MHRVASRDTHKSQLTLEASSLRRVVTSPAHAHPSTETHATQPHYPPSNSVRGTATAAATRAAVKTGATRTTNYGHNSRHSNTTTQTATHPETQRNRHRRQWCCHPTRTLCANADTRCTHTHLLAHTHTPSHSQGEATLATSPPLSTPDDPTSALTHAEDTSPAAPPAAPETFHPLAPASTAATWRCPRTQLAASSTLGSYHPARIAHTVTAGERPTAHPSTTLPTPTPTTNDTTQNNQDQQHAPTLISTPTCTLSASAFSASLASASFLNCLNLHNRTHRITYLVM